MIDNALSRPSRWAVRRAGEANLILLALLLLALVSTALGVADRVRGMGPTFALSLAVLGLFGGWLISLAPLSAGWSALVAGLLGFGVVLFRVGRFEGELLALLRALVHLLGALFRWVGGGGDPSWGPVWQAVLHLGQGAATLLGRVAAWGVALIAGEPAFDPAAVSFVWGLGLWAAGVAAGWLIYRRGRPLWAVTPSGVLLLTAFYHVWGSHVYLLGLLLAAFLLMAAVAYQARMRRWRATGVDYPELRPQTIVVSLFLSLALVTAAQALVSLPFDRILDPLSVIRRERSEEAEAVAESFGMEAGDRTVFREARSAGLPRSHLLDAGAELSEQVVMLIRVEGAARDTSEAPTAVPPSYYWRSHTYERYTGSGWATGETETVVYAAGAPAITRTLPTQPVVRQEVRRLGVGGDLAYAAGTLMVADHGYAVAWRSPHDPFGATVSSQSYRADSFLPVASEAGLRDAGGRYPAWVRQRYLALPDGVPERVRALARDLTATAATRYDRARAIEAYLRRFPYTLDVSIPPGGRDVVDYFLFDLKRGYCDYYASAMVVLARAAGLPARLAVGYASGTYDADEGHYVVTEATAHAWPEIYFPAYGWIRFEPTAGRRPPTYAAGAGRGWTEPDTALGPAQAGWWRRLRSIWWQALLAGVVLLGLTGVLWLAVDRWRLGRQEPTAALATLYWRLRELGRGLSVPMEAGDTPREFCAAFANWLERAAGPCDHRFGRSPTRDGRVSARCGSSPDQPRSVEHDHEPVAWPNLCRWFAVGADELAWLAEAYARASYSPRPPDAADRERAVHLWGRLWWRLRLIRLARGLGLVQFG